MKGASYGRPNKLQSLQGSSYKSRSGAAHSQLVSPQAYKSGTFNPSQSVMTGQNLQGSLAASHRGTVPMTFRGQDRALQPHLGSNPNKDVEDEYIQNLQQQMHFMDLELKILKEKVIDDEKKSGIGTLFDDEKSSFEHIKQLKEKYQKMRKDYAKQQELLNKVNLDVVGEQLILDSQINILMEQNQKVDGQIKEHEMQMKRKQRELEREYKQVSGQNAQTQYERDTNQAELDRELEENYTMKMTIAKDLRFNDLENERFQLEVDLTQRLIDEKKAEIKESENQSQNIKQAFQQNTDLQNLFLEEAKLKSDKEAALVELEYLNVNIKMQEQDTELLIEEKDTLLEAKREADSRHDELKKTWQAKQEIEAKRIQAMLNKNKNVEVKELLAQEETVKEHNVELQAKLDEEMRKHDGLLDEWMDLDEQLRLHTIDFEKKKVIVDKSDEEKAILKKEIEQLEDEVNFLQKTNQEEQKLNKVQDESFRKLSQMNAALKAKLRFISEKYDYKSNVNVLKTDDFKELVTSNELVNGTVGQFMGRLDTVKEEIQRFEMFRNRE